MLHRSVVPGSALPPELLIEIVDLAATTPEFDFAQPDWTSGVPITDLHALLLTSHALNEIATPHLYGHLVVRTPEAGQALVRTLQSERWQVGEMQGRAAKWVTAVSIGKNVAWDQEVDGSAVQGVLGCLDEARLERVALVGVKIGPDAFAGMQHVKSLQLNQVAYTFPPHAGPLRLFPALTHLSLADLRHTQPTAVPDRRLTDHLAFPALTHLALHSRNPHASLANEPEPLDPGLPALCPQLECVVVAEAEPWFASDVLFALTGLTRLKTLIVLAPLEVGLFARLLLNLGHTFDTLEIAKPALSPEAVQAIQHAFAAQLASVADLKRLALGQVRKRKRLSAESWALVRALERVAEVAKERGVQVEWLKAGGERVD